MFDLILFDLDDTILEFSQIRGDSFRRAIADFLPGYPDAEALFQRFRHWNNTYWQRFDAGEISLEELREGRFQELFTELGMPELALGFYQRLYQYIAEDGNCLPEARETLQALKKQAELGVVTNGIAWVQERRLALAQLQDFFSLLLAPDHCGYAKPHQNIFAAALNAYPDISPERILFVGDNLDTDVLGANRAGMVSCWLNRGGANAASAESKPRYEIQSLSELLPIVGREPVLQRYWRSCFSDFAIRSDRDESYSIPGFSDPLLSAYFSPRNRREIGARSGCRYFNEVSHAARAPIKEPPGFRASHDFHLGELALDSLAPAVKLAPLERMPLSQAIEEADYWRLLEDGFPSDLPFLKPLNQFLAHKAQADFRTAFLLGEGKRLGLVTVGIADGVALVMNAVISRECRGKGLSAELAQIAKAIAWEGGARKMFFWTKHEFLLAYATEYFQYRIFQRNA